MELKSLLRDYKKVYPDKNCKQIYNEYLSDWEERSAFSREQKQFNVGYRRSRGKVGWKESEEETVFKNKSGLEEKDTLPTAIFGSVILVIGGIAICVNKKLADKIID